MPSSERTRSIKNNKDSKEVACCYCNECSHVQADFYKQKQEHDRNRGLDNDDFRDAMVSMLDNRDPKEYLASTALLTAYDDSYGTAHMTMTIR